MDFISERVLRTSMAIEKLVRLLTEESSTILSSDERSEVEELNSSLVFLNSFLKDLSVKFENSTPTPSWLKLVIEVSDLAENVASDYALKALKRRNQNGFANFFNISSDWLSQLSTSFTRDLGIEIKTIKELLLKIQETQRRYYFYRSSSVASDFGRHLPRFVSPLLEEFLVGIDSLRNELVEVLIGGDRGLSVTSLVGPGGIGKTTLAEVVFRNEAVERHFDLCSWITVTRSYDIKKILRTILVNMEIYVSRAEERVEILRQHLRSKRYIFFFDDVWREDFVKVMRDIFPDDSNGSRIIVTTRSETVAASCKQGLFDRVVRVETLPEEKSRDLFFRIAFQDEPESDCPQELEQLSLEFNRICEGLPLAIVTVAGLLLSKDKVASEWQKLLESLSTEPYSKNPHLNVFSKILARSFDDLPYMLKLCFLYFSVFPKGSMIPYDKLFKLWISEGFVEQKPGATMEEVAEECLNVLIDRNLVQACEGFYGLEKFCRVPLLMHEITRQEAERIRFCDTIPNGPDYDLTIRLPFYSVFVFKAYSLDKFSLFAQSDKLELLTVLVFENVPMKNLPNEVGMLYYLKYLGLKNTLLKKLPRSIGNLLNLQTLDVRNTLVIELPIEISKLQNLQHLLASRYDGKLRLYSTRGVKIKAKIGILQNLETLMIVEAQSIGLIKELAKLRRLRRLGISRLTGVVASTLCASIEKMDFLVHLSLHSRESYESLDVQEITTPPPLLEHVVLKGRLLEFPLWISSLQNLTMLCLSFSRLMDDPLPYISRLPNLVSLWLYRAYDGEKLSFEEDGFQSLKLLVLRELPGLEAVEIEQGSMPLLEELRIGPCPRLEAVPSGIERLTRLKSLAFYDMPNKLVLDMQPDGGSEYLKVSQVHSVQFGYRVQGREYVWFELGDWDLIDHLQGNLSASINGSVQHQTENRQLSFCYSDDDSVSSSSARWINDFHQPDCSSDRLSFFTDDIEDC